MNGILKLHKEISISREPTIARVVEVIAVEHRTKIGESMSSATV